jgi:hypothetical protein
MAHPTLLRITAAILGLLAALFVFWAGSKPPGDRAAAASAAESRPGVEADAAAGLGAYAKLPLAFTENRGQVDPQVRYYLQGPRAAFFLTSGGVTIALQGHQRTDQSDTDRPVAPPPVVPARAASAPEAGATHTAQRAVLALRFVDGNPSATIAGEQRAAGNVHYLRGRESGAWQTDVARFARIAYRDLWPGIDLMLSVDGSALKYEFRVRPGANPSSIRLSYAGADSLAIDHSGALVIGTALGPIRDAAPVSWQAHGDRRVTVASRYALQAGSTASTTTTYGFDLGAFDASRELIIDPGIDYSTFLGGSSMDRISSVAVDASGNAYVVGFAQSTDFPATTGGLDRTFNGGLTDVVVAKLNANGSGLVYATYLGGVPTPLRRGGGDNVEFGRGIAVDANGHAYITGLTDSSDFPTTTGSLQPDLNATPDDARDAFVAKLNPSGSGLVYSTFFGGTGFDDGWNIAVDAAGSAVITGDTDSTDLPTTAGAAQPNRGGGRDAFVARLNASGSALVYATYLGGTDNEVGNGIAIDGDGRVVVAGGTRSADFPTTAGAFRTNHSGGAFDERFDAFVTKLSGTGGLVYSTFLGGSRLDVANDVAVDASGNAYVAGSTLSADFPTTDGAFDRATPAGFVTKVNAAGTAAAYSTFIPGGGTSAIALATGTAAWLGGTAGADAPTTPDAFARENRGSSDAWLGRLSATGAALEFGTFLGGANADNGADVAVDTNGAAYLAGTTFSPDFPVTSGAFDTTFAGDPTIFWGDGFVARFGAGGGTVPPPSTRTTTTLSGRLDGNRTAVHTVLVGSAGPVDLALDWSDSRARLTVRVRNPAGTEVFLDGGTAKPKLGRFQAAGSGNYQVEVRNTTSRRTNYTLTITHPIATSFPGGVSFLSLDPTTVTGGTSSSGFVSLTAAAPSSGAVVTLASSNPTAAAVPPSVTIPGGGTSATFTVSTGAVAANTTATITASYNSIARSVTLAVNAAGGPALSTLTLSPTSVAGGSPSTGTVTLTSAAPAGGAVVSLSSSLTDTATVPPTMTIPAGSTSGTFTISTSAVSFDSSSAIAASHGGVLRSAILFVTPSGSGGGTQATLSVTATGRSGERVVSSPSGINVTVGSTGSASFVTGTSITLSVASGREAIWSGSCSSGGNKRRSCTGALNGNASVTANVR